MGKSWSRDAIEEFCQDLHTQFTYHEQRDVFIQRVVDVLTEGCVIGWMQGKFEWGPKALGNRSIFGRSFQARPRERINESIKFREKFRPFAPIVLDKYFDEWFEFPQAGRHLLQYMLATVRVKEEQNPKSHRWFMLMELPELRFYPEKSIPCYMILSNSSTKELVFPCSSIRLLI